MEDRYAFWILQKDVLITVEGYFKPEEWTDSKSGEKRNHTGIQPLHLFPIKEDYTTGKAERLHSEKSKQTIEADCRFSGEISESVFAFTQYSSPPSPSSE